MSTVFPTAIDTIANPATNDKLNVPSHAAQHTDENTAITAIETKLGTGASTATANNVLRGTGAGTTAFGKVVNADVDAAAAIAYSKLNLAGSVTNADIANAAGIPYSKLSLTDGIVNADINSAAAIALTKLAATSWTSYTPTWTSSGTAVSLGNATLAGLYQLIGKTCIVSVSWQAGNTTTFGTGNYFFALPFTAANRAVQYLMSQGVSTDSSASASYPIYAWIVPNTAIMTLYNVHVAGATYADSFSVGAASPFTYVVNDTINISATYEIA